MYFDQQTHAWACICMVENNIPQLETLKPFEYRTSPQKCIPRDITVLVGLASNPQELTIILQWESVAKFKAFQKRTFWLQLVCNHLKPEPFETQPGGHTIQNPDTSRFWIPAVLTIHKIGLKQFFFRVEGISALFEASCSPAKQVFYQISKLRVLHIIQW